MSDLILASNSPYRHELLIRLCLPFESASPDIDKSYHPGESAEELVRRLSANRAETLTGRYPQHLVTGSDQAVALDDDIFGKPHTPERAIQQLRDASSKSVTFLIGLTLLNSVSRCTQVTCVSFAVYFRHLGENRTRRCVEVEHPLDYTGSFKAESLGANLFCATEGEDATSLTGLPLIRLVGMFLEEGVEVP